jgi:acyl dehydratase
MGIDRERLLALTPIETPYAYTARDTMLHGLSIGLGMDPMDVRQLPFVYDDAGLKAFPTMSAVLGWIDLLRDPQFRDPRCGVDASKMVVAEVVIHQHTPLPVEGRGLSRTYFAEVIDKGAGKPALLRARREVLGEDRTLLATMDTWMFVRDAGGFGGPSEGGPERVDIPTRPPDAVCSLATPANLALLYRLSLGDHNALHADPAFAARVGFERPILHGIANFSIAVHAVLRSLLDYDPARYAWGKARFVKPVFPGDTLVTEMWQVPGSVLFRSRAAERGMVVMDGGKIELARSA